jgi:hypothetical protein
MQWLLLAASHPACSTPAQKIPERLGTVGVAVFSEEVIHLGDEVVVDCGHWMVSSSGYEYDELG